MACSFFDLECLVFMVKASYEQKPYRRIFMETFGAEVRPSPTSTTQAGKKILEAHPDSTGSLGIAISEAIEVAATNEDTNYSIGSCLNHVLLHQSVVGLEAKEQMAMAGEVPDVVVGCVGGGSNYGGLAYPFMAGRLRGETPDMRFLATEPAACPTLTKGRFAYDFGDTAQLTPLLPMYTLGHDFVPAPVHAGGLRYHGDSPSLSLLVRERAHGGGRVLAERGVRGRGDVREGAGHRAGAGVRPRDPRRGERGARRARGGPGARDPVRVSRGTATSTCRPTTTT